MAHEPRACPGAGNAQVAAPDRERPRGSRTGLRDRLIVTFLAIAAVVVVIVLRRGTLADSLDDLAHANFGWLLLALAAEAQAPGPVRQRAPKRKESVNPPYQCQPDRSPRFTA
jgi:hypothetical protein